VKRKRKVSPTDERTGKDNERFIIEINLFASLHLTGCTFSDADAGRVDVPFDVLNRKSDLTPGASDQVALCRPSKVFHL